MREEEGMERGREMAGAGEVERRSEKREGEEEEEGGGQGDKGAEDGGKNAEWDRTTESSSMDVTAVLRWGPRLWYRTTHRARRTHLPVDLIMGCFYHSRKGEKPKQSNSCI